jgi:hypothetical protein
MSFLIRITQRKYETGGVVMKIRIIMDSSAFVFGLDILSSVNNYP